MRRLTRWQIAFFAAVCVVGPTCVNATANQSQTQIHSKSTHSNNIHPKSSGAKRNKKRAPLTAAAGKSAVENAPTKAKTTSSSRRRKRRPRGQLKIDAERAQSIQEALIRGHYLNGQATGKWNTDTEEALRRYQADHGWQTKTVPDSRALIKLGLGPSKDHLLNPESAMTTVPDAPKSASLSPTSHSADPGPPPVGGQNKAPAADPSPSPNPSTSIPQ